jgi:hypothetical protein
MTSRLKYSTWYVLPSAAAEFALVEDVLDVSRDDGLVALEELNHLAKR